MVTAMCVRPYTPVNTMQYTVGVGDLKVSDHSSGVIVTFALGSCLGIAVHDAVAGVGGLLHAMLPDSRLDPSKAEMRPARFVDSGVALLFRKCYQLGARKERMRLVVAGGAARNGDDEGDLFRIGKRNMLMLRKLLWKNGVLLAASDVGGSDSRSVTLEVGSGIVMVKRAGKLIQL